MLQSGIISGAAIDVAEEEPLPPESPLWQCGNLLVTPHMAWYSEEASSSLKTKAAQEAVRFLVFINVMKNLSVDCDCCAVAEDPCMRDIGILASLDPVAVDQACLDLVYAAKDDPGQSVFLERVTSLHGSHIIDAAVQLNCGTKEYDLVEF